MATRLFAVLRTIVVSIIFLSIWTWFVPRWVNGNGAFDNPRPLGWIVIALEKLGSWSPLGNVDSAKFAVAYLLRPVRASR